MLPSENSSKSTDEDDAREVFKMLTDLVSIFAFFLLEVVDKLILLHPSNSTLYCFVLSCSFLSLGTIFWNYDLHPLKHPTPAFHLAHPCSSCASLKLHP